MKKTIETIIYTFLLLLFITMFYRIQNLQEELEISKKQTDLMIELIKVKKCE